METILISIIMVVFVLLLVANSPVHTYAFVQWLNSGLRLLFTKIHSSRRRK